MPHRENRGKTALVTGASGGIGFALARVFAHEGYNVVLVARNTEKLMARAEEIHTTCGVTVTVISADLSLPTGPIEVCRELQYHGIPVHALVNNAGTATHGYFAASDWQSELAMLSLNILTLTRLTKIILPEMLARGEGKILNVASTSAYLPGPLMAVYNASKSYVLSFSEALREELRGSGIHVTALCPGPTRTELYERACAKHIRLLQWPLQDPAAVARMGYDGVRKNRPVVVAGWLNRCYVQCVRLLPRRLVTRAAAYLNDR
ncbi:MAG: SDR family oxidoreductase [Patescibacteria group bacterium]|nr:SDR family oxidoreductase [Patescibacteria group bacterium]